MRSICSIEEVEKKRKRKSRQVGEGAREK